MSSLRSLKSACSSKQYCSFKDLKFGDYLVSNFVFVATPLYGTRLRCEVNDKYIYLPKRFADAVMDSDLDELNKEPLWMLYTGRDPSKNNK